MYIPQPSSIQGWQAPIVSGWIQSPLCGEEGRLKAKKKKNPPKTSSPKKTPTTTKLHH